MAQIKEDWDMIRSSESVDEKYKSNDLNYIVDIGSST